MERLRRTNSYDGTAVGNRIKRLEDAGVIKSYSLIVDEMKLGMVYTAFVVIYMKTTNHDPFLYFIDNQKEVIEAHRVSGEGCYHLKLKVKSHEQINLFLNHLLEHGNYKLYLSIKENKHQSPLTSI